MIDKKITLPTYGELTIDTGGMSGDYFINGNYQGIDVSWMSVMKDGKVLICLSDDEDLFGMLHDMIDGEPVDPQGVADALSVSIAQWEAMLREAHYLGSKEYEEYLEAQSQQEWEMFWKE